MSYRPEREETWDVIVVGGGPAGMMAAGRAAEKGARVLLLEKNERLGKKLSITGGGRCNITNGELDVKKWTAKLGTKGKFLLPAFARFGVQDTLDFFQTLGLKTKTEEENRVFPKSDQAEDVCRVMADYLKKNEVTVRYKAAVSGFQVEEDVVTGVKMGKQVLKAGTYTLATGGKSRPETGSTGEGLSGPLALNMSREVRECFKSGGVVLSLDLMPGLDAPALDRRVQDVLAKHQNKQIQNSLAEFLPAKLIPVALKLADIDPRKIVNIVTREERLRLSGLLKDLKMNVSGFLGFEKAIVTGGGAVLEEVDFRSMRSRLFPNLYIVGDVLDFNRPSGGYSLQICWTTGYLAGDHAASSKE